MSPSRTKEIAVLMVMSVIVAGLAFWTKGFFDLEAFRWARYEEPVDDPVKREIRKKLVRIVDLPDIPALHWKGGKYKDLGYFYEKGLGKEGIWVAYIDSETYLMLSEYEKDLMLRLAARQGIHIDLSEVPEPKTLTAQTVAAEDRTETQDESRPDVAGKDDLLMKEPIRSVSMLNNDPLDQALLPEMDREVLEGGMSLTGPSTAVKTAQKDVVAENRPVRHAPGMMSPDRRQTGEKASDAGMTDPIWLGVAGLAGAAVIYGFLVRRRQKKRLSRRMKSLAGKNGKKGTHKTVVFARHRKKGPESGSAAGQPRAPHLRKEHIAPEEALRAMHMAAQGGLKTRH